MKRLVQRVVAKTQAALFARRPSKPRPAAHYSRSATWESLEARRLLAAITVDTHLDTLDGVTASISALQSAPGSDGKISLREAIIAANNTAGTNEIWFDASTDGIPIRLTLPGRNEDNSETGDLDVRANIVIHGRGAASTIIQAGSNPTNGIDRVFEVHSGASLELDGATVRYGQTTSPGADGGGIRASGRLVVAKSIVTHNTARSMGAADSRGGGIVASSAGADVTVINSTIQHNVATSVISGGFGGGLAALSSGARLTVVGSTIAHNTAIYDGGGINVTAGAAARIFNSTISGNQAELNGGGIAFAGGSVVVTNSTITGNIADSNNDGDTAGGGVHVTQSGLTLHNTLVAGNYVDGASIPNDAARSPASRTITARNSLIGDANSAAGIAHDSDGDLTTGTNNIVGASGGGTIPIATLLDTTLADHGGPTATHALAAGGLAVDRGDNNLAVDDQGALLTTDQRDAGFARLVDGDGNGTSIVDIGAFEYVLPQPPPAPTIHEPAMSLVVDAPIFTISGVAEAGALVKVFADANNDGVIDDPAAPAASQQLEAGEASFAISMALAQNASNHFLVTTTNESGLASDPATVPRILEDSDGDILVSLPGGGQSFELFRSGDETIVRIANGPVLMRAPIASLDSLQLIGSSDPDALTVVFSGGNPIPPAGVVFTGGGPAANSDDILTLDQGTSAGLFHTVTHYQSNAGDGSIQLDPDGHGPAPAAIIAYTGLGPITDTLEAPHRVFTFSSETEAIALTDALGPNMTLDSDRSESITFANATQSLAINAGAGDDTITVLSFDAAFQGALTIEGSDGNDTVHLDAAGLAIARDLALFAETIAQTEAVIVSGLTTFVAGDHVSGVITLDHADNDFRGAVFDARGADIRLRDANDLSFASGGSGDDPIGRLALIAGGDVNLGPGLVIAGDLTIAALGAESDVTQDGPIVVGGNATVSTTRNVLLHHADNEFGGPIGVDSSAPAATISLRDDTGFVLASARGSQLILESKGPISQTGPIVDGATFRTALTKRGVGLLTLSQANTFTGGAAISAGAVAINGSLADGPGNVDVTVSAEAMLAGAGVIHGTVEVAQDGRLGPGSGAEPSRVGLLTTGDLVLGAGSIFQVEIGGTTPGTTQDDHDQVIARGTVVVDGAELDLQALGGFLPAPGSTLVIIANDGPDPVQGTGFASLPEGSVLPDFFGSGLNARITYAGGDGNDVAIVVDGGLVHSGGPAGDSYVLRRLTSGAVDHLQLLIDGAVVVSRPRAGTTFVSLHAGGGDDALTVDYASGGFFAVPIFFDGEGHDSSQPGDKLILQGGAFDAVTLSHVAAHDGEIALHTGGDAAVITFTGLEQVDIVGTSITHLVINLPDTNDETDDHTELRIDSGALVVNSHNQEHESNTISLDGVMSLTVHARGGDDTILLHESLAVFTTNGHELRAYGGDGDDEVIVQAGVRLSAAGGLGASLDLQGGVLALAADAQVNALQDTITTGAVHLGPFTLTLENAGEAVFDGVIDGAGGLVKTGPGVLRLGGVHAFTGATWVAQGSLEIAAGGALQATSAIAVGSLGNSAVLQVAGSVNLSGELSLGEGGEGTLDLRGGAVAIAGAVRDTGVSALQANYGVVFIESGLAVDTLNVGVSAADTASRSAMLTVHNGAVAIGNGAEELHIGRRTVGRTGAAASEPGTIGVADFSGASSVTIHVARLGLGQHIASPATGDGVAAADQTRGTLLLSATGPNFLSVAESLVIGDSPYADNTLDLGTEGANGNLVVLGDAMNVIHTDLLILGGRNSHGLLRFADMGGVLVLRGATGGASAAKVQIADNRANTSSHAIAVFDTRGGAIDAQISTLSLGRHGSGGSLMQGGARGRLIIDAGSVSAVAVVLGDASADGASANPVLSEGTVTINGGAFTVADAITDGGGAGRIELNAGTLQFATLGRSAELGTLALDFASGVIQNVPSQDLIVVDAEIQLQSSGPRTFSVAAGQSALVQAAAAIAGAGSLLKSGQGALELQGLHTYAGETIVEAGSLKLTQSAASNNIPNSSAIIVNSGAVLDVTGLGAGDDLGRLELFAGQVLRGAGVVTGGVTALEGSNISPGDSVGVLTVGEARFAPGASLEIDLHGLAAGTHHDQLVVNGAVRIDTSAAGAKLILMGAWAGSVLSDFVTIIDNVSPGERVVGEFSSLVVNGVTLTTGDLADGRLNSGDAFTLNGQTYRIYYNGGDGNDVVLLQAGADPSGCMTTVHVDDDWTSTIPGEDPDGAGPAAVFGIDAFAMLQQGVDRVCAGGTVYVRPGEFAENVVISKPLTLDGPAAGDVVVAPATGAALQVVAGGDSVTLRNLRIAGTKHGNPGIDISHVANPTLVNVSIEGAADAGIRLTHIRGVANLNEVAAVNNGTGLAAENVNVLSIVGGVFQANQRGLGAVEVDTLMLSRLLHTENLLDSDVDRVSTLYFRTGDDAAPDIVDLNNPAIGGEGFLRWLRSGAEQNGLRFTEVGVLELDFVAGSDLVRVAPHSSTRIVLDGGHAAQNPGDTLHYLSDGVSAFQARASLIATAGHADIVYANWETVQVGGPIVLAGTDGDDTLAIVATGWASGSYQLISRGVAGPTVQLREVTRLTFQGDAGNDQLVIQHPPAALFAPGGGIVYHGGTHEGTPGFNPTGDRLSLLGGAVATVEHIVGAAGEGLVRYNTIPIVTYAGLEAVTDAIAASERAIREDSGAKSMTWSAPGDGAANRLERDGGGTISFESPSASLAIDAGAEVSAILVDSIDPAFRSTLTIAGESPELAVHLNAALRLGSPTSSGNLTITAHTIGLGHNIYTDGGAKAGEMKFQGDVALGANVLLVSDALLDDGSIVFAGAIYADNATSEDRRLAIRAGDGTVRLDGDIGNNLNGVLADLDVAAASIELAAGVVRVNDGPGGETVEFAGALTLLRNVAVYTDGASNEILFTGSVDGPFGLTLAAGAGDIRFQSDIGGGTALAAVTVASAMHVDFAGALYTSGGVTQTAGSGATSFLSATAVGGPLNVTTNAIVLNAPAIVAAGAATLNARNSVMIEAPLTAAAVAVSAGSLTVAADITAAGAIQLTTEDEHEAGQDLTVQPLVRITSASGDVTLRAGDDLTLSPMSMIRAEAESKRVILLGDFANQDTSGSVIEVRGQIVSNAQAVARGSDDSDTIILHPSAPTSSFLLDGAGGNDSYHIYHGELGAPVLISDTGITADSLMIFGLPDDETFLVRNDRPNGESPQTGGWVSNATAGETVHYTQSLELLHVFGQDGNDLFQTQPSQTAEITIYGGAPGLGPVPGEGPEQAGDKLEFDPLNNPFQVIGASLITSGGSPGPFRLVNFVDIEHPPTPSREIAVWRFDFDGRNQATQDEYTGVSHNTVYSVEAGYGWQNAVTSVDRGGPTPLLRDFHLGDDNIFLVDVANGTYLVNVTLGGAGAVLDQVNVYAEGILVLDGVSSSAGQFLHRSFPVTVHDGRLELRFDDAGGEPFFALNSIEIYSPPQVATHALSPNDEGTIWSGSGASPGALVTVSTTAGRIASHDADPHYAGTQVRANEIGDFHFRTVTPATGAASHVFSIEATGRGSGSAPFPDRPLGLRRFDFNGAGDMTADGFTGVRGTDLYTEALGYGWRTSVWGFEQNLPGDSDVASRLFFRDGAFGYSDAFGTSRRGVFRVSAAPDRLYDVRVYVGDQEARDNIHITHEDGALAIAPPTALGMYTSVVLTNLVDANGDGALELTFSDTGGDDYWVVNGLEVAPAGGLPSAPWEVSLLPDDATNIQARSAATAKANATDEVFAGLGDSLESLFARASSVKDF